MIKIGTLCWLTKMPADLVIFNGRVVKVVGPEQLWQDGKLGYKVDGEWLLGARGPAQNYVVGGEFLIPFSDPDNSDASRTDKPITVTA